MIDYSAAGMNAWTRMGMRKAFGGMMEMLCREHEDVIVLAADVASSAGLSGFAEAYPTQFYDLGVAEQNMTGTAAGLAKEGFNVFIASFAPFVSMRAFEAVRTLVGYMRLNVKIVALASGFSLGPQGNTHYGLEDVALMRTIPGMQVLAPADCMEMAKCLEYLAEYDGPAYLRLTGIDGSPGVYRGECPFHVGKGNMLREGEDAVILASGSVVGECLRAARPLSREGVSCAVVDMHTVKPLDTQMLDQLCGRYKLIVSVEEHSVIGGLGSAVAERLAKEAQHPPLLTLGIEDMFPHAGSYSYMLQQCGLSAAQIHDRVLERYRTL